MCVYYCMEKLNRVGSSENVFINFVKSFYMGIIWSNREFPKNNNKKTLGSAANNRTVGR